MINVEVNGVREREREDEGGKEERERKKKKEEARVQSTERTPCAQTRRGTAFD